MFDTTLFYLVAIFGTVFGSVMLLTYAVTSSRAKRRIQSLAQKYPTSTNGTFDAWMRKLADGVSPLAKLSVPDEELRVSSLRIRFAQAGLRAGYVPPLFFALKTLLALLLPSLLWLAMVLFDVAVTSVTAMLATLLAAAFGFYLPNVVLGVLVRRRQRRVFESLPDALDLMTVCIEAGLGTDAAVGRVAKEMTTTAPVVSEELQLVVLEMRAGRSKEQALRNLALRTGVGEVDALTTMLIQAEQFGNSIAESLRVHAEHLRTRRRQQAEERAAKVALKLLMPLVFCIFPALILIMLGPSFIQIGRVLMPSLAG